MKCLWQGVCLSLLVSFGSGAPMTTVQGADYSRPAEYPKEWAVLFRRAAPLRPDYHFGHQTTLLKQGSVYPPAAKPLPCKISWEHDIPVKLRDGVVIYVDVLRPAGDEGRLPTLVAWSPYGKSIPATHLPSGVPADEVTGIYKAEGPDVGFWSCHGYAVVHPDPRGVDKSEGNIHAWGGIDADDAYDVIEWIATQTWSNSKVGLHGTSWLAMVQWLIAAKRPPHLSAIAPWNGMTDVYRNSVCIGGIRDTRFGSQIAGQLTGQQQVERFDRMAESCPLITDYWADKAPHLETVKVPAYVATDVTTDLHRLGTFEGFRQLGSSEKWLRVNNRQEWTDQYDPENQEDLKRFFDHYLKGQNNGWENTPRVRMAILDPGGEDKVNIPYPAWPIPSTHYTRLYLEGSSHSLSRDSQPKATEVSYQAKDGQTEFTYRFDKDTQVTGYLKAHLWVEAKDNDEQDIFILVEKLDSNGKLLVPAETSARQYFPIPPPGAGGRLRVSMRAGDEKLSTSYLPVPSLRRADPVPAGKAVAVDIAILPESLVFHRGEQLRLLIAGHEFVTGEPSGGSVAGVTPPLRTLPPLPTKNSGTEIVRAGGSFDSYLQIPVVDSGGSRAGN